jgi:hypothetical protein
MTPQPPGGNDVHEGMKIPDFTKRDLFSARKLNDFIIKPLNALLDPSITRDGQQAKISISNGRWNLLLPNPLASNANQTFTCKQYKLDAFVSGLPAMYGDYLSCHEWDNFSLGAQAYIAKAPFLRYSMTTRAYYPDTMTYTYPDPTLAANATAQQTRNVSFNGVASGTEVINPRYLVGDLVYGIAVNHTGITVSSVELTILEVAVERSWKYSVGQAA